MQFTPAGEGPVAFANWLNPLVTPKEIRQEEVDFFKKYVRKGDLAIDIGANIGHLSMAVALAAGKEGLVLAFDPNPHVFRILQVNAGLNPGKTNIHPLNMAVTDQADTFFYRSSEASFNNGGITAGASDFHGRFVLPTKVQGVVLKDLLEERYAGWLSKLTLVKIDTEGYDLEVIKSIRGLLGQYKPVVISECFGKNTPEQRHEHFDLLAGLGYRLYHIAGFVADTPLIPIEKPEDMNRWKHFDFIATHA
ncbi:MAG: FkbM family methyltransferase [Saprospirales bacterium]|nr:FkbM family methyltransferase [Saprospirales bacterium]MBK8921861.1 FkbM family methyltransferase [Saprospirales bacterium]